MLDPALFDVTTLILNGDDDAHGSYLPLIVQGKIGARTAWRAGDTGRGIRVAVLDTGVDATHPDLRGQIAATKNFTHAPGVTDRNGHGTFVAGEVAGTGAAADGERRGVAFGARL